MQNSPRKALQNLWNNAVKIQSGFASGPAFDPSHRSLEIERQAGLAMSWLLPQSKLCAVYSIPMDVLETFVVKVGGWVVGAAGAWPESAYLQQLRSQKMVNAPCRLRPFVSVAPVSPALTESLSRSVSLQELELAA